MKVQIVDEEWQKRIDRKLEEELEEQKKLKDLNIFQSERVGAGSKIPGQK